jgi:hypothetical protein
VVTGGSDIQEKWTAAQIIERRFHCDEHPSLPPLAQRRAQEAAMRRLYAGLLRIPFTGERAAGQPFPSVTDFGCGPESLLLCTDVDHAHSVAVDPLEFSEEDERRYRDLCIRRDRVKGEAFHDQQTEESWLYNCLQHVEDPTGLLVRAAQTARNVVRIFEWVDVPPDALHLHVIRAGAIEEVLRDHGFGRLYVTTGVSSHNPYWTQSFYAAVWEKL